MCRTPSVPWTKGHSVHNCHNSTWDVRVTECFASAVTRPLPPTVTTITDSTRPISVACEKGVPVHLDG
ncbi:hypothetical protein PAL_GLEAN10001601 [Pteropus alecto]|uniref:Ribonuclease A-domain domain-containing protein n=1 Tax=Pteropus alecto TaxID=9402 RepID=L5K6F1_PTEAL|nr:hypothetical protein PAL_GLEAN10001601 [Pteropus alecto]